MVYPLGLAKKAAIGLFIATWAAVPDAKPAPPTAPAMPNPAGTSVDQSLVDGLLSVLLQPGAANAPAKPVDAPIDNQVVTVGPGDRSKEAGAGVHVDAIGTVDVHVSNMEVTQVLRMISERTRRNIVASKKVSGPVSADLYEVSLEEALDAILSSNGFVYQQNGRFIYVYARDEMAEVEGLRRKLTTRVFILRYVSAKDAEMLLTPLVSKDGRISKTPPASEGLSSSNTSGSSGGGQGTGGNTHSNAEALVLVDYPENIERIAKVLKEFDVAPQQVLIEATILRAQINEDNALGIDFTTVGGIDFSELSSTSPGVQSITTGSVPPAKFQETTLTARTNFNQNVPAGGFTFGIIKDQISVFIRALEQVTDVAVLANPKILALNKQKGEVIVGRRDGYLTTTITETTAVQSVEFLETGTRLIFRPFICDDGQIRMEIHPEDSTGGVTAANLPFKQTTEVTTNILVQDGHTVLIGGLFREVNSTSRSQIPLLGNIPVAGALFRSTNDTLTREEIIILLTVHIVKSAAEDKEGEELRADTERIRIGQRRAAQWFGRERLSQAYYRWALEHLGRGNLNAALWDTTMAIRTSPHQVQAVELREKVMRRRMWDEDGSSIRRAIQTLISREHGAEVPPFSRPAPPFRLSKEMGSEFGYDDEGEEGAEAGPTIRSAVKEAQP